MAHISNIKTENNNGSYRLVRSPSSKSSAVAPCSHTAPIGDAGVHIPYVVFWSIVIEEGPINRIDGP